MTKEHWSLWDLRTAEVKGPKGWVVRIDQDMVVAAEAEKDQKISSFMLAQECFGICRRVVTGLHRLLLCFTGH